VILENQFTVAAPVERVFAALHDTASVAASLPGARVGSRVDERTVKAELRLTLGKVLIPYRGTLRVERSDRGTGGLTLTVDAREGRGQGTARASVDIRIHEARGSTTVTMRSEVAVSGRAAKVAHNEIQDAVQGLLTRFGDNLGQRIAAAAANGAQVASAGSTAAEPLRPEQVRGSVRLMAAEPAPAERIAGSVRLMTAEPVPAEKVAPLVGLSAVADGIRRRPWLPAALAGIILMALVVVASRRRR
jgi:uncharacterized protein